MKFKLITAAALVSATGLSFGAFTATVTSYVNAVDPDLAVVDNSGALIGNGLGVVGVGYFASFNDAAISGTTDFSALTADFVTFAGTTTAFGTNADSYAGMVNLTANGTIPNGTIGAQTGNMYVLFGNGATFGASTQLAVWKSNTLFGTENEVGLGAKTALLQTGQGSILLGLNGGALAGANWGGDLGPYTNSIKLVQEVPEPTSSLLFGVAGLALLIRRKR